MAGATAVPESYARRTRREVHLRLAELAAVVSRAGMPAGVPAGGFYLWVDARSTLKAIGVESSLELCLNLARRHGIGIWPGEDFLAPGWLRLSAVAAARKQWKPAIERLKRGLKSVVQGG